MPIPKANNGDSMGPYEQVAIDEWITGIISDVLYEPEHQFTGAFARVGEAVRLKFKLDGYEKPHYSAWMTFSYSEKANLYKTFIVKLVEGAHEYFDFDVDLLKGMKVKTMWTETVKGDRTYQSISMIKPNGPALKYAPRPKAVGKVVDLSGDPLDEINRKLQEAEEAPF